MLCVNKHQLDRASFMLRSSALNFLHKALLLLSDLWYLLTTVCVLINVTGKMMKCVRWMAGWTTSNNEQIRWKETEEQQKQMRKKRVEIWRAQTFTILFDIVCNAILPYANNGQSTEETFNLRNKLFKSAILILTQFSYDWC